MQVFLGVDIGTYSTKAVALRDDGTLLDTVSISHSLSVPQPGFAEQDAEAVWWNGLVTVVRRLVARQTFDASQVTSIAVSTTAPCVVPLDDKGQPLRPGILYGIDVRASAQIERLHQDLGLEFVLDRYGQLLSSQSAGPKMLWIRDHEPEIFRRTRRFVSATTFLVYKLTGRWWIDRYIAPSYAPFFRLDTLAWDTQTISKYLSDELEWPEVGWPDDVAGRLTPAAAAALHLPNDALVTVGTADAMAEAVAAGAVRVGDLFIMYGSSMFFIATTDHPVRSRTFWLSPGLEDNRWALAGGMSTAGTLTRWFMQLAFPESSTFRDFYKEAETSPPGSRGLLLLPYFSGERTPISDPDARGVLVGLSLKHTRADVSRAILESIAFGVRQNIEAFEAAVGPVQLHAAGGGVTAPLWPQIVSDVCQRPQRVLQRTHAAVGDALLAGRAAGAFTDLDLIELSGRLGEPIEVVPHRELRGLYNELYGLYTELYRQTTSVVHRLARTHQ